MYARMITGLCAVALCAGAAYASGSAKSAGEEGKDKLICRTDTKAGSRLRKERTCRTRAEWAEIRRQTKQDIDEVQRQPPISGQ